MPWNQPRALALLPTLFGPVVGCLFLTMPCFSPCRYWDKEIQKAEKSDARKPSLTKAIIKCYWKSYLVLGIFTLIEVTAFLCGVFYFSVWGWVLRQAALLGERGIGSEDKTYVGYMV